MPLDRLKGGTPSARAKLNALIDEYARTSSTKGNDSILGVTRTSGGTIIEVYPRAVGLTLPKARHTLFPVYLTQVSGTPGAWKYEIRHGQGLVGADCLVAVPSGGKALTVDLTDSPHYLYGTLEKATRGLAHYNNDGYLVVDWIDAQSGAVPVKVFLDGGSAGGGAATCTFTYHIEDLYGGDLADRITPQTGRCANTKYIAATGYGIACIDEGTVVLLSCNERFYVESYE